MRLHRSWTEFDDSQVLIKLNNVIGGFVDNAPLGAGIFWPIGFRGGGVAVNEG